MGLADDIQRVGIVEIDRTEVSIKDLRNFVEATNFVTKAEKESGGLVYELGWTKKIG
jgi:formylglycine-generating enzyme required for sulfatase activity